MGNDVTHFIYNQRQFVRLALGLIQLIKSFYNDKITKEASIAFQLWLLHPRKKKEVLIGEVE